MSKRLWLVVAVTFGIVIFSGLYFLRVPVTTTPPPYIPDQPIEDPAPVTKATSSVSIIGYSNEGRPIERYTFGTGSTSLLFVGGIHGGYEWNSSALAYEFITAFRSRTILIPDDLTVVIVPTLNPDGLYAVTGLEGTFTTADIPPNDAHETGNGRFNAHDVDLNRNFDCKWKPESTWRNRPVSAGTAAFSEPESVALRDLVIDINPIGVVFWHSQANAVYGSECESGILPGTLNLMHTYATAAGYDAIPSFDAYPVSGDAEGWLASIGIPAVTVELGTRTTTEWSKNKAAVEALLSNFKSL
jgi:predicted deacylase